MIYKLGTLMYLFVQEIHTFLISVLALHSCSSVSRSSRNFSICSSDGWMHFPSGEPKLKPRKIHAKIKSKYFVSNIMPNLTNPTDFLVHGAFIRLNFNLDTHIVFHPAPRLTIPQKKIKMCKWPQYWRSISWFLYFLFKDEEIFEVMYLPSSWITSAPSNLWHKCSSNSVPPW